MATRIGVAIFKGASPYSRADNIACEYEGQPFSFSATTDLPSHTLWITNLSMDSLHEAGLGRSPSIASDAYFRTRLSQMVQELGLHDESPDYQVAILARVLGCAAQMLKTQLGLTQFPAYGMPQAIGQLYGSAEPHKGTALLTIAEQSCQRFTACERTRRHEKADTFSFWHPRAAWAEEMLEIPLPCGDVELLQKHQLPMLGADPQALVQWAFDEKIPLFARVKNHGVQEQVGKLMNYGAGALDLKKDARNGGSYDARNFREWCALPELAFLANYADVEVLQVAVAKGWANTGLRTFRTRRSVISYAYGLAAENLWVGTLRKNSGYFNISKTLSTAWLQAEDRMRCLQTALKLQRTGMEITTFGNGRIGVVCPVSVRNLIPQAALEADLLYPASLKGLRIYPANKTVPLHIQQHLIASREYERNIHVDHDCLKELERVHHALKSSAR